MPFNSGIFIYGVLLAGLIIWGLKLYQSKKNPGWHTTILALTMLIIGYSSFILLVVRANAPTPMNEDNPSDPVSLHDYLDRKQYGDWPVLYGPYYSAPRQYDERGNAEVNDLGPMYEKDPKTGKYVKTQELLTA